MIKTAKMIYVVYVLKCVKILFFIPFFFRMKSCRIHQDPYDYAWASEICTICDPQLIAHFEEAKQEMNEYRIAMGYSSTSEEEEYDENDTSAACGRQKRKRQLSSSSSNSSLSSSNNFANNEDLPSWSEIEDTLY